MSLDAGASLGHYEIVDAIGAGGMGEVYRARDTHLGRDVAIKVLPESMAGDPERLERFEREARLLAQLNHPNVATLHGVGEDGDTRFLVMELVNGEALAERIARGRLSVEEAVRLFVQIADGLEAAHEKGIIHRDLKPANVVVTPDGMVKILDFGLAKASTASGDVSAETSESPTVTKDTALGVVLGTAPYMSPEQARGKAVDKRTDIWAFGCCLYEALTGTRAFQGDGVPDTVARILEREPDLGRLPQPMRRLVQRCLEKEPRQRLRDIGDARYELENGGLTAAESSPPGSSKRSFLMAAAAVALGVAITFAALSGDEVAPSTDVTRFSVVLPPTERSRDFGLSGLAVSPDGSAFVYGGGGGSQHVLRRMDREEVEPIPGTRGRGPFFSPDGKWLGLWANGGDLVKVSLTTGASERICTPTSFYGADWGDDGWILYADGASGIWRVSAAGGEPEMVVEVSSGKTAFPELIDGDAFVFVHFDSDSASPAQPRLMVGSIGSGRIEPLELRGSQPRYLPSGHLALVDGGQLKAVGFDPETLRVSGPPVALLEELSDPAGGVAYYDLSDTGTLVYWNTAPTLRFGWVGRNGATQDTLRPRGSYDDLRLSPDGSAVAFMDRASEIDIWAYAFDRDTLTRLSHSPNTEETPAWSPDGSRVAYMAASPDGILSGGTHSVAFVPLTGAGAGRAAWETPNHAHVNDWLNDGGGAVLVNEHRAGDQTGTWRSSRSKETRARSTCWSRPFES